tara:strand:- start:61 stop:771 length:711 start_codon:yes stop_codon:yes gene_type:complete
MFSGYDFEIYWGPRKEDPSECARRLSKMLKKLRPISPLLSEWASDAMDLDNNRVLTSKSELEKFLAKGVSKNDGDHKIVPELGFARSICNAFDDGSFVHLRFDIGVWSEFSHNGILLNFPVITDVIKPILSIDNIIKIFRILIECWSPDFGHFTSSYLAKDLDWPKIDFEHSECYWVTYLSKPYGELPELPEQVKIMNEKEGGKIIILIGDSFAEEGTGDLELVKRTRSILAHSSQ